MTYLFTKLFSLICAVLLLLLAPSVVLASEIRLDANKTEVRVGEEFIVSVIIHTRESVNAIEGIVIFPPDLLDVKEIRDGNSVINLWAEKPQEKQGKIIFSGITPGGFSGANQYLFSIIFTAKTTGRAIIALSDIQMLKNDGFGTKIMTTTRSTEIFIQPGDDAIRRERVIDNEPPSYFTPTITSSPYMFGGKYFITFATQDKGSGIDRYEIREGRWGWYRVARSPHLLRSQKLDKRIYVKAIDNAGNERIAIIEAQNEVSWLKYVFILGIVTAVALFLMKILWSKFVK